MELPSRKVEFRTVLSSPVFFSPLSRKAKVRWFRKTYYDEVNYRGLNLNEKQHPSVVAHSFGTYILGNALLKYDYLCFNKVILCGSILPRDFPWDKLIERGQVQAVRNEYGAKDVWAKRVGWFIPGTGPSGVNGFICKHEHFEEAKFHYDHSEYFEKGHIEAYWVPFLEKNLPFIEKKSCNVPSPKPTCPIVLLIIILLVSAVLSTIAYHAIFGLNVIGNIFDSRQVCEPTSGGREGVPDFMVWYLQESDLAGKSARELTLMRNEIYARCGWWFNRTELREHFSRQRWYTPKYQRDEFLRKVRLTKVQDHNAYLISNYQKKNGLEY